MLKIERSTTDTVTYRLSGRIEPEDVPELRRLLEVEERCCGMVLDLEDVTLVDREGLAFLGRCEKEGIKFANCPAYVREWLDREQVRRPRGKLGEAPGRNL